MTTQNTSNPKKQATIEQTKHELSAAPLTVMAQYIKDFSFENPNPLQTLKESHEAPEMNLNLDIQANPVEEHIFEITLHLKAEAKRASHTLFIAELQYAGTFKIGENVPKESVHPILMIECPRLLFPYARLIIANMTREGGFPTLALTPIDFVELYRKQYIEPQQQKTATVAKASS
jgi:preprotein translocase subunit SecB